MEKVLIQKYLFEIPATTGTQSYSYNFKSDELYNYLSGIACPLCTSLPTADDIKIELRDDFRSILSFSPAQNWCKVTTSVDYDNTNIFKPLCCESKGKNFYLNVKVVNSTAAFSFVALFQQTMDKREINIFGQTVKGYDLQSFTIPNAALGANYNINLPSDYKAVMGVNFTGGDSSNIYNLALDINDNVRNLLDPVPVSVLMANENVNHDKNIFPVMFESANKQVNLRLTSLKTITYTPSNFTVTFLLIK